MQGSDQQGNAPWRNEHERVHCFVLVLPKHVPFSVASLHSTCLAVTFFGLWYCGHHQQSWPAVFFVQSHLHHTIGAWGPLYQGVSQVSKRDWTPSAPENCGSIPLAVGSRVYCVLFLWRIMTTCILKIKLFCPTAITSSRTYNACVSVGIQLSFIINVEEDVMRYKLFLDQCSSQH